MEYAERIPELVFKVPRVWKVMGIEVVKGDCSESFTHKRDRQSPGLQTEKR